MSDMLTHNNGAVNLGIHKSGPDRSFAASPLLDRTGGAKRGVIVQVVLELVICHAVVRAVARIFLKMPRRRRLRK